MAGFSSWQHVDLFPLTKLWDAVARASLNKVSHSKNCWHLTPRPFISSFSMTETREIKMSALQCLPQQCEMCLSPAVTVKSVSIFTTVLLHGLCLTSAICIIHTSKGHTCVYPVYHYVLTPSRHMLSSRLKNGFKFVGFCCLCMILVTFECPPPRKHSKARVV